MNTNECLSGGNCSYIVRLSVGDLHGPTDPKITWGVTPTKLKEMQSKDKLCTRMCLKWLSKEKKCYNLITSRVGY